MIRLGIGAENFPSLISKSHYAILGPMRRVVLTRAANRALARLPANVERTIRAKINLYAKNPAALANNVKALQGFDNGYRLRVGDWRVIFLLIGDDMIVRDIGTRGSIYD